MVKDLQGPDASRTKEFVWSPETHQKCPVTPSDEHDYKEDVAQASFQENRMEFSGPYLKKSMSFGPREASRKALGYVLAFYIPKLPFCSVVASPHQSPWCPWLWPHPSQLSMSWHLPWQVGRPLILVCSGTPRFSSWKSHVTGSLYPPIPIPGKWGQLVALVAGYQPKPSPSSWAQSRPKAVGLPHTPCCLQIQTYLKCMNFESVFKAADWRCSWLLTMSVRFSSPTPFSGTFIIVIILLSEIGAQIITWRVPRFSDHTTRSGLPQSWLQRKGGAQVPHPEFLGLSRKGPKQKPRC